MICTKTNELLSEKAYTGFNERDVDTGLSVRKRWADPKYGNRPGCKRQKKGIIIIK